MKEYPSQDFKPISTKGMSNEQLDQLLQELK